MMRSLHGVHCGFKGFAADTGCREVIKDGKELAEIEGNRLSVFMVKIGLVVKGRVAGSAGGTLVSCV